MPDTPTVSVVIPAYNAAWCVGKAIDSVLAQDYRDFEIIVVNDGSTDDTRRVLARFGSAIRVIDQSNGGMSSARNAGIRQARGEFIAFLDADDWWLPSKLGRQVELMRARPEIGFCSCTARVEDPDGRLLNLWQCPQSELPFLVHLFRSGADVPGSCSAVMARRQLVEAAGGFDESLRGAEDPDLWIRLAATTKYACIAEPLTVVLRRPGSVSRNLENMRESSIRMMRKNRSLLPREFRGSYWRNCVAGILGDYAKWRYREGDRPGALREVFKMIQLAPIGHGRLALGLLKDIVLRRPMP